MRFLQPSLGSRRLYHDRDTDSCIYQMFQIAYYQCSQGIPKNWLQHMRIIREADTGMRSRTPEEKLHSLQRL
jgi:hypothetical protein